MREHASRVRVETAAAAGRDITGGTDRSRTVLVSCSNLACQNSTIAARRLEALGYTHVLKYAEGKEDWIGAGLPVESGVCA